MLPYLPARNTRPVVGEGYYPSRKTYATNGRHTMPPLQWERNSISPKTPADRIGLRGCILFSVGFQVIQSGAHCRDHEGGKGAILADNGIFHLRNHVSGKPDRFVDCGRCLRNFEFSHITAWSVYRPGRRCGPGRTHETSPDPGTARLWDRYGSTR